MGVSETMMRVFTGVHAKLIKVTGGGFGGGGKDGSVLVLTHEGAKSGKVRDTPLMFLNHPDGGYVIVASKAGASSHPSWYHNLKAHPDSAVDVDGDRVAVHAREVDDTEREQLWGRLTALDDRWESYQAKTDRKIPLLHLEPR